MTTSQNIVKFTGTILTSVAPRTFTPQNYTAPELKLLSYIIVDLASGKILATSDDGTNVPFSREVPLAPSQILIPGFVDTHTHAPQFLNAGIGMDLELLQWLEKYTFPTEAKCVDVDKFAKPLFEKSVKTHLSYGSTTCVYFSTIHTSASLELARICERAGQRAYVGKVNMDRNSPDFYVEQSAEKSLGDTRAFVETLQQEQRVTERVAKYNATPLVQPIITPRFVPTCTEALMRGLAQIAKEYDLPIQSHVSENMGEVMWVKSLHPKSPSYSHVYDEMGLLTDRTIMAHGIYLTNEELKLLAERQTTISHCPNSNYALQSGNLDVRRLLEAGVNVAIGTDVSGGYSASMLNAVRNTLIASTVNRFVHRGDDMKNVDQFVKAELAKAETGDQMEDVNTEEVTEKREVPATLSIAELFYMATLAGAKSLKIDNVTGSFEAGKEFDALLVDCADLDIYNPETDTAQDKLQRFLMLGDDRQIKSIWVGGRKVQGAEE